MSRKRIQKPDEFAAMKQLYEVLKDFDQLARNRIVGSVEDKISEEAPKPRIRRKKTEATQAKVYGVVIEQGDPESEAA